MQRLHWHSFSSRKILHLTVNSCSHSGRLIKPEILKLQFNEKIRNKYSSAISCKTYKLNSLKTFFTEWTRTRKWIWNESLYLTKEGAQKAWRTFRKRKGFVSEEIHYLKLYVSLCFLNFEVLCKITSQLNFSTTNFPFLVVSSSYLISSIPSTVF